MLSLFLIVLISYFLGSVPGALWSSKVLHGVDIREYGSKNAGATNAFRVVGWPAGVLATIVDMGKGYVSASIVASLIRIDPLPALGVFGWDVDVIIGLIAGLAAIVGHMFPIFARFEGGKGVNTAAGILLALAPITMLYTFGVFAVVLFSSRYVSLASMTAAVSFPTIAAIRRFGAGTEVDPSLIVVGLLIATSIIVAHRSNIGRLIRGNESRVGSFAPAQGMLGRGELQ
ncbi:MAG: acyl-phosphate glycerol 3-phosphate acyltransferase [Bacteroidetes bacterium SW_9_63_38]|nr:MAG: acyl-phosphate glycerol 3-phosphate acyltransferase [Bacteroidetes bacterium SW_9_63_38]